MDAKERINALCAKVIAAPDGSEELAIGIQELRSALADHVEILRRQISDLRQKSFSHSDDMGG